MEAKLDSILDSMMQRDQVTGVLIADNQGLSCGSKFIEMIKNCNKNLFKLNKPAKGTAYSRAAGMVTEISQQAAKIHPNLDAPVVILESEK